MKKEKQLDDLKYKGQMLAQNVASSITDLSKNIADLRIKTIRMLTYSST